MRVLIFYDNQYYVGEVLHTLPDDGDRASIAFMQQVPKQNIFRWGKEDFDTVERKFVMEWDVPMASRNGRTWSLLNFASSFDHAVMLAMCGIFGKFTFFVIFKIQLNP